MNTLLLISDLHGQSFTLRYLQQIIDLEKPDGVVVSGDITTGTDIEFFDLLEKILLKNKVGGFVVWGNSDIPYANSHISKSKFSIHMKTRKFGNFMIFGLSETDDPIDISDKIGGKILVTHRPPQMISLKGKYKNAPIIHISGHLHTRKTAHQYPSTFHISVPTLQNGEYAMLNVDNKDVRFSRIGQ